jgi:hypothetical protein
MPCDFLKEDQHASRSGDHSEIDKLISDIQARLPELRSHCLHWPEAESLQHNAAIREIEKDTLRKLRLFARMLDARLGAGQVRSWEV